MGGILSLPTIVQRITLQSDASDAERETEGALGRIGGKVAKAGGAMTVGLTVPIVALAATGVKAASDLAESNSKVGVVFEENAEKIRRFAKTSAEQLGLSQQAALEATGTFGNLFRALGIGTGPAADMSTALVKLAADLASFNNANPEDVLLALRSGLLGEAEPLRQFGVSLSAARIEAEALSSGLVKATGDATKIAQATIAVEKTQAAAAKALKQYGDQSLEYRDAAAKVTKAEEALAAATAGKVPELTAAQKAQAAYNIIQKDTALAQGDFARTSEGLANRQRILAAQVIDLKAGFGNLLLPAVTAVAGKFVSLFEIIGGLNPETQKLVGIALAVVAALGPMLIIVGKLAQSFSAIKALSSGAGLLGFGPLLPVVLAVAAAGLLVWRNWDKVRPVIETITGHVSHFIAVFRNAIQAGDDFGFTWGEGIAGAAGNAGRVIREVADGARQVLAIFKDRDFVGGPFSEDSPIIDGLFKVRDAIAAVVGFVRDHWKPILIGAFIAFAPPVLAVIGLLALLWTKFDAIREVVGAVARFFVGTFIPIVVDLAKAVGQNIGELIGFFREIAPQVQEALGHVVKVISVVLGIVKEVIQFALGILAAVWRAWGDDIWSIVKAIFNTIREVINAALDVVANVIRFALALINGEWGKAWDALVGILRGVWDAIYGVLRGALSVVSSILGGIVSLFGELLRPVGNFLHTWVVEPVESMVQFFRELPGKITRAVVGLFDGVKDAFKGAVNWIIDKWNNFHLPVPKILGQSVIPGVDRIDFPDIPRLGTGGHVTQSGLALVGDKPEIIDLPRGATVTPLSRLNGAGPKYVIDGPLVSLSIVGNVDDETIEKIAEAVEDVLDGLDDELGAA